MNIKNLPKVISIFPLSNVIFFPKTSLPLNIFEKRYLNMVEDNLKTERFIGMIQPKNKTKKNKGDGDIYKIGCLGKITNFNETSDGRYSISLKGISRFEIIKELKKEKLYRIFEVDYSNFQNDVKEIDYEIPDLLLNNFYERLKLFFKKKGYLIDWKELRKLKNDENINAISMIAPFSVEEKQSLLESYSIKERINKLEKITNLYLLDDFENKTVQ